MPKAVTIRKDQTKETKDMTETKAPSSESIRRALKIMKFYHTGGPEHCSSELAKLLDEFGIDFVCQHACKAEAEERGACPEGRCERPLEYTGDEDCTCREAMYYNIDCFVGYRSNAECRAANASMYGQIPKKKRS
jgi:hypothetical protein